MNTIHYKCYSYASTSTFARGHTHLICLKNILANTPNPILFTRIIQSPHPPSLVLNRANEGTHVTAASSSTVTSGTECYCRQHERTQKFFTEREKANYSYMYVTLVCVLKVQSKFYSFATINRKTTVYVYVMQEQKVWANAQDCLFVCVQDF